VYVSLQGTFDTLPVTELFGLLASAAKTGALRLEAGDHEASVFLTGGLCCAVESDASAPSAASDTELAARLVDVGFAFARLAAGSFRFSDSELAEYDTGVTTPLEPAVLEIRSLLDQWREIEATIPSLDVRVRLAPVLRDDEVVVTAREWSLLVALEGMPTVRELVARRQQPMMDVCRDLKGLVDRGAVEIGAEVPVVPATVSLLEPSEPYAPDADDFVTAEAVAAAAADADAVAAGIVSRMARPRLSTPDVFAGADEVPADAVPSVGIDVTRGVTVSADAVTSGSQVSAADGGEAATEAEEAAPDRGALLRLFSALKES
jgi:Domain of unknown function (DUF4388)